MSDGTRQTGLGKLIYSVNEPTTEVMREERADQAEVEEADEESFPASDPPGFAGGNDNEQT